MAILGARLLHQAVELLHLVVEEKVEGVVVAVVVVVGMAWHVGHARRPEWRRQVSTR